MNKKDRNQLSEKQGIKALELLWADLNDSNFKGALSACPVFEISPSVKYLAGYSFNLVKKKAVNGKIIISAKLFYLAPKHIFIDALLHEMAHQFCIEELNLPFEGHGKIWQFISQSCGANPAPQSFWQAKRFRS